MSEAIESSFASRAVVAKLIELGYLNDGQVLTNEAVRIALERLQEDLWLTATIQTRVQRNDDRLRIE